MDWDYLLFNEFLPQKIKMGKMCNLTESSFVGRKYVHTNKFVIKAESILRINRKRTASYFILYLKKNYFKRQHVALAQKQISIDNDFSFRDKQVS